MYLIKKKNMYCLHKKKTIKKLFFFKRVVVSVLKYSPQNSYNLSNKASICPLKTTYLKISLKYLQYFWLMFRNRNTLKFWNFNVYHYFKSTANMLQFVQLKKKKHFFFFKRFLDTKFVFKRALVWRMPQHPIKLSQQGYKKHRQVILYKKLKKPIYLINNDFKIFCLKFSKSLFILNPKKLNIFVWRFKFLLKSVVVRKYFANAVISVNEYTPQLSPLKLSFDFMFKHFSVVFFKKFNTGLNIVLKINLIANLVKNLNLFLNIKALQKFNQHLFYVKLKKKSFSFFFNWKIKSLRFFFQLKIMRKYRHRFNLYLKNKKYKKKAYRNFIYALIFNASVRKSVSCMLQKKKTKNVFFFHPRLKTFKFKFKFLKKNRHWRRKLLKFNIHFWLKKFKYLSNFLKKTNKFTFFKRLLQKFDVNNLFLCAHVKVTNTVNFNKFYLLYAKNLSAYKKFNFFFSGLPSYFSTTLISAKHSQNTLFYVRYLVLLLKSKKQYQSATKIVPNSVKIKQNLESKSKRQKYLRSLLNIVKLRRFFFFKLTLSSVWKKRKIDYNYGRFLKKAHYFHGTRRKNINKKHQNFYAANNLFKTKNKFLVKPLLISNTVFIYKQISNLFFKYKYFSVLKQQQTTKHYFLYGGNYLSWNFLYFWYWYIFLYSTQLRVDKSGTQTISHLTSPFYSSLYSKQITSTIVNVYNFFYLNKNKKQHNYQIYFNFFFKIVLKYILLKNLKYYQSFYVCQLYRWKKKFNILKKVYKKFAKKFRFRGSIRARYKRKRRRIKKLKLRLRWTKRKRLRWLKTSLTFFNTIGYYNYFKRKLFKKKRVYLFFFSLLKAKKKINKLHKIFLNISAKIGIIKIVIFNNNTYVTLTNLKGDVIYVKSGGLVGIKGPNRATSVTSEEVTSAICNLLKQTRVKFLILKFSGVLYSRKIKAALKVFRFYKKYKILRVVNTTPKAHNGIRLKKKKRL